MSEWRAIEDALQRLVDAWNRGDAHAFGGAFTPTAEYVTGAGQRLQGRESIAALLEERVDGSTISVEDRPSIEHCGPGAKARFSWSLAGRGGVARRGTITCTLARHSTGWLIEALHTEESREPRGSPTRG